MVRKIMIKGNQLSKRIYKGSLEKKRNIGIRFLFLLVLLFASIGCSRDSLSSSKFISLLEKRDYSVVDISDKSNTVFLAVGVHFQIYYYEFKDSEAAFNKMEEEIKLLKTVSNDVDHESSKDYDKYEISNKNVYTIYSRVDNTLIFVSALSQYRAEVMEIINYLGY